MWSIGSKKVTTERHSDILKASIITRRRKRVCKEVIILFAYVFSLTEKSCRSVCVYDWRIDECKLLDFGIIWEEGGVGWNVLRNGHFLAIIGASKAWHILFKEPMMKLNLVARFLYTYENEGQGSKAWKHVWCPHYESPLVSSSNQALWVDSNSSSTIYKIHQLVDFPFTHLTLWKQAIKLEIRSLTLFKILLFSDTTLLIFDPGWFCQIKSGCPMANISSLIIILCPGSIS